MIKKYILVSVETWSVDKEGNHIIHARRETEIDVPRSYKFGDLTDTVQRASASMVETLKDYLDNH